MSTELLGIYNSPGAHRLCHRSLSKRCRRNRVEDKRTNHSIRALTTNRAVLWFHNYEFLLKKRLTLSPPVEGKPENKLRVVGEPLHHRVGHHQPHAGCAKQYTVPEHKRLTHTSASPYSIIFIALKYTNQLSCRRMSSPIPS